MVFRTSAEFLWGVLLMSILILFFCLVFTISAGTAFLVTCTVSGLIGVIRLRRKVAVRTCRLEVASTLLVCTSALLWSIQAILSVPRLLVTQKFEAWSDYFIHAGEIAQFADFNALRGTSIFAAGAGLPVYHYASYMLPAALTGLTNVLALSSITAYWTPFGFLLLGLGVIVLGGAMAAESGGVLALIAVILIPSASHYWIADPFFDFPWLLQISSSGCYALASASLSLVSLIFYMRERRGSSVLSTAFFTLATGLFRVHIFMPLVIMNAAMIFVSQGNSRMRHRLMLLVVASVSVFLFLLGLERIPRAPHFFTGPHHPVAELLTMLSMQPSPSANLFPYLANQLSHGTGPYHAISMIAILASGLCILCLAAFGAWLPLYLVLLVTTRRHEAVTFIPLAGLFAYLSIVVFFPGSTSEPLEFAHRPFVLPYFLLAIWTSTFFAESVLKYVRGARYAIAAGFVLLATPISLQSRAQMSDLLVSGLYYGINIPRGLIDAAAFLRVHSQKQGVFANTPSPLDDAFLALAQRPEFSPGTFFLFVQSGLSSAAAARRAAVVHDLTKDTTTFAGSGITWIVTFPGPHRDLSVAAFNEAGFIVSNAER